jgi:hypothetical protein
VHRSPTLGRMHRLGRPHIHPQSHFLTLLQASWVGSAKHEAEPTNGALSTCLAGNIPQYGDTRLHPSSIFRPCLLIPRSWVGSGVGWIPCGPEFPSQTRLFLSRKGCIPAVKWHRRLPAPSTFLVKPTPYRITVGRSQIGTRVLWDPLFFFIFF